MFTFITFTIKHAISALILQYFEIGRARQATHLPLTKFPYVYLQHILPLPFKPLTLPLLLSFIKFLANEHISKNYRSV